MIIFRKYLIWIFLENLINRASSFLKFIIIIIIIIIILKFIIVIIIIKRYIRY